MKYNSFSDMKRGRKMLVFNFHAIGNNLYALRKKTGMTQAEVAEAAGVSDRTYAEIERGSVNMRLETALRICRVLGVTPDVILTEKDPTPSADEDELMARLQACSPKEKETALRLLSVYLDSLK